MNKQDLIDQVAAASGQSKAVVRAVMEAVLETAMRALASGHDVRLFGLGRLYVSKRKERPAWDIRASRPVVVPERNRPMLKASKPLIRAVNGA